MTTNKSIVIYSSPPAFKWRTEDRSIPEVETGSVVLKVLASPIVQYQGEYYRGESAFFTNAVPFVPGATGVCRVHAVCSDATALQKGDLVLVDPKIVARDAPINKLLLGTAAGMTPGSNSLTNNVWRDGLWAQYCRLPLENVYKLDQNRLLKELGYEPVDLNIIQNCALAMAGLMDARLKPGDTLLVAPATGRFAGASVLVGLAMGATVVAAGRRQEMLDRLVTGMKENSASLKTVLLTGDVAKDTASFQKAVGPQGADVYLDWSPHNISGTPAYLTAAFSSLRYGGTAVLLGAIFGEVSIPYIQVMWNNLVVRGRHMFDREHMEQAIKLAESGKLPLGKRCGTRSVAEFGLEKFDDALDEAAKHPGWGGVVHIVPN